MKDLLELLIKSIVDSPEDIRITEAEMEKTIVYEIRVNPNDVGKVIGKHGRIINAIRTIIRSATTKDGKKVTIELLG